MQVIIDRVEMTIGKEIRIFAVWIKSRRDIMKDRTGQWIEITALCLPELEQRNMM